MVKTPLFSLLYASARPERVKQTIHRWELRGSSRLKERGIEWLVALDGEMDSAPESLPETTPFRKLPGVAVVFQNHKPFNAVKAWNIAAAKSTGSVLIAVSDDFTPPHGWDDALLSIDNGAWVQQDKLVIVADGNGTDIATLPILTRKRYESFGWFYFPAYESLFADSELTAVAHRDRAVIWAKHLTFRHEHPDMGGRDRDWVDALHGSLNRYARGQRFFEQRRQLGFPEEDHVDTEGAATIDFRPRIEHYDFTVSIVAARDDLCLTEGIRELASQGVRRFDIAVPDRHWDGTEVAAEEREAIARATENLLPLRANGRIVVATNIFPCPPLASREETEIAFRQTILDRLARECREHVLIMDTDELWIPGALNVLVNTLDFLRPTAALSRLIPVAGLPGYPIQDSLDWALIYINPRRCKLKGIRIPAEKPALVHNRLLYHFSATRRTFAEIVAKHRGSAHYGDPDYAFDDWLKLILPEIRPGSRDVHMYHPADGRQLWPKVRAWQSAERGMIPHSLVPYLGFEH